MKNYTQAPLPFQGQKRGFLKDFKDALKGFSKNATYVDLFGGSGLLSHTVKQYYPNARVIYNDFDNYKNRLDNVDNTNKILQDLRLILQDEPKGKVISKDIKLLILNRIMQEKGFVDCVTLSSSLCFSMKYITEKENFAKETLYNNIKQKNYVVSDYMQGLERRSCDYQLLFEEFKHQKNVVFLIDPPYLSTDASTYKKDTYWKITNYLNVLKCLQDQSYFYFTSEKSQITELCDWMQSCDFATNPFADATTKTVGVQLNHSARYNDIMIFKNAE